MAMVVQPQEKPTFSFLIVDTKASAKKKLKNRSHHVFIFGFVVFIWGGRAHSKKGFPAKTQAELSKQ